MTKQEIVLTQGKVAIVDEMDYERLNKYKWHAKKDGNTYYAARKSERLNGKQTTIRMHREILSVLPGQQIDHINHNGLDNRRANLRLCTYSQQQQNRLPQKAFSKYKGVWQDPRSKRWQVAIRINGKRTYLGYYVNEIEAAKAYDKKATQLFGEFANLNFGE